VIEGDIRFLEKLFRQFVRIWICHVNGADFRIDDEASADAAGLMGAIQIGIGRAGAVDARLDDGVLFGMHAAAEFVVLSGGNLQLFAQASHLSTVGDALGAAIIAAGEDLIVSYQDGAHLAPQTGAALGGKKGHLHKILLPTGA